MTLFGFNISRAAAPVRQKSFGPAASDWLEEPASPVFTNAYQQVVWVYRAINVLAEQVANIPFLFSAGERGRENLITGGPLLDFYSRPHPQINRFQYWELRIIWLMLRGECFRVPIYSDHADPGFPSRRLERILVLDPAHFQHLVENHKIVGWRYTGFGPRAPLASQVFLPEEVWFEKLPNPFDFWRGLPPLHAAITAARTDFAAANFMRGIIENNADSGVIVRTDKPLDPEQQEQLFAALRERKRKAGTADRPVLLSGCSEVIKPQLSSTDLQFLENRKFSRAEICAAFGVPEEIVTTTDSAKYDVMHGARLNFIENRVAPLCGRLEAGEEPTVKSLDSRAVGWFDLDSLPILQQARRDRLAAARTGFDMGIPFNELNRVLDLGFKALPWGNAGYLSSRFQRLGETAAASKVSRAISPAGPADWSERLRLLLASDPAAAAPDADLKSRQRKLRKYLFEQRRRALARLGDLQRLVPNHGDATETAGAGTGSSLMLPEQAGRFDSLFMLECENAELTRLIRPWLREDFCSAAALALAEGGHPQLEIPSLVLDDFLAGQEPSIHGLNRVIAEAFDSRLSRLDPSDRLADSIRAIYNEIANERADELVIDFRRAAFSAGRVAGLALRAATRSHSPAPTRPNIL